MLELDRNGHPTAPARPAGCDAPTARVRCCQGGLPGGLGLGLVLGMSGAYARLPGDRLAGRETEDAAEPLGAGPGFPLGPKNHAPVAEGADLLGPGEVGGELLQFRLGRDARRHVVDDGDQQGAIRRPQWGSRRLHLAQLPRGQAMGELEDLLPRRPGQGHLGLHLLGGSVLMSWIRLARSSSRLPAVEAHRGGIGLHDAPIRQSMMSFTGLVGLEDSPELRLALLQGHLEHGAAPRHPCR